MLLELIGKGLLIGLIFGVPAGAIGALTIQRTLEGGFLYGFLTAFSVAIMNPATVVSFLVAFTSFGLNGDYSILEGSQIVLGVLLGTVGWWGILSLGVSKFRTKITDIIAVKMNAVLGILLMIYGICMAVGCLI